MSKIGIIGGGVWGSALAKLLSNGFAVGPITKVNLACGFSLYKKL